ncbi:TolC family protein [Helicobacter aurati]|uniref:TolC family protein n=1 Tax=Helicobacter aurati TaxID=137778 RepID=A0A3D8J6Q6_9HELI|nr:TolC family protein [Helicobacter aurati]
MRNGIFIIIISLPGFAQTLEIQDVIKAIEQNSLELIENKAQFESLLAEGRSNLAWQYPFIEANGETTKTNGEHAGEWSAIVFVKPKFWWVNTLLRTSLDNKNKEYQSMHKLLRNISFIEIKRIYLTYIATKEKYKYHLKREANFLQLLNIARKRLVGGSVSRKDFTNFESAYTDSLLTTIAVRNELLELQKSLFIILGLDKKDFISQVEQNSQTLPQPTNILSTNDSNDSLAQAQSEEEAGYGLTTQQLTTDHLSQDPHSNPIINTDIRIANLHFAYIEPDIDLSAEKLQNSLYTEILDLQAKQHQSMSKYEARNHWDTLELGAGVKYSLSSYNPTLQVSIPLPVTRKQSYLKAKYMSLESGALAKQAITKKQIAIKVKAYIQELALQREYINIAERNTQVKRHLAELNRLGYESQQVTLFEYVTQENAFVDSQIALVNAQIKYIDLVALLEHTLGESFTKIN